MFGTLLIIAIFIIIILTVGIYQKSTNAICLSRRRLEGKTVIVTGGTAGIGLEIATDLAHRGARVIIAYRYQDKGTNVLKQIIQETENEKVIFKVLDLASLGSVRKFAADILKTEEKLDILINNAALGFPKESLTTDGINLIMQVNYFGTFLLTLLLLPLLKKTGTKLEPSRIITTASCAHLFGRVDLDNLNRINYYWSSIQVYANSKLCLVLFARELAKRINDLNVVINNVDPGAVGTKLFYSLGTIPGAFLRTACFFLFKTPWQGAQTALHAALDKKAGDVSGEYFRNCEISKFVRRSDDKTMKRLWKESIRIVKLKHDELEQ